MEARAYTVSNVMGDPLAKRLHELPEYMAEELVKMLEMGVNENPDGRVRETHVIVTMSW